LLAGAAETEGKDSSQGNAMETPMPRSMVRLVIFKFVIFEPDLLVMAMSSCIEDQF